VSVCLSVRATFDHISATGCPIDFVFGMRQRAARPDNHKVCRTAGVRKLYVLTVYPAVAGPHADAPTSIEKIQTPETIHT